MGTRKIRVGIDVGGTHTKAVALDNDTHEIIGESVVMTTHDHEMGVAAGVIEYFENCLTKNNIDPDDVVFIAHSTTQATNALLEGDVAKVGIIGMANGGIEGWLSKKQSNIPDIDLGTGRFIRTCHTFIKLKDVNEQTVEAAIQKLQAEGAQVIVASKAFGVDSIKEELLVRDIAEKHGLLVSVASDISKLYGLTRRTPARPRPPSAWPCRERGFEDGQPDEHDAAAACRHSGRCPAGTAGPGGPADAGTKTNLHNGGRPHRPCDAHAGHAPGPDGPARASGRRCHLWPGGRGQRAGGRFGLW